MVQCPLSVACNGSQISTHQLANIVSGRLTITTNIHAAGLALFVSACTGGAVHARITEARFSERMPTSGQRLSSRDRAWRWLCMRAGGAIRRVGVDALRG